MCGEAHKVSVNNCVNFQAHCMQGLLYGVFSQGCCLAAVEAVNWSTLAHCPSGKPAACCD